MQSNKPRATTTLMKQMHSRAACSADPVAVHTGCGSINEWAIVSSQILHRCVRKMSKYESWEESSFIHYKKLVFLWWWLVDPPYSFYHKSHAGKISSEKLAPVIPAGHFSDFFLRYIADIFLTFLNEVNYRYFCSFLTVRHARLLRHPANWIWRSRGCLAHAILHPF